MRTLGDKSLILALYHKSLSAAGLEARSRQLSCFQDRIGHKDILDVPTLRRLHALSTLSNPPDDFRQLLKLVAQVESRIEIKSLSNCLDKIWLQLPF